MTIFILASKLHPSNLIVDRKEQGDKFLKIIKEKVPNVKWIAHYAILGPYDFIDIFEADNEHEAAKVSLLSRTVGADFAECWTAIKYSGFLKIVEELE